MRKIFLSFFIVLVFFGCAKLPEREKQVSPEERTKLMSESDLVFQGLMTSINRGGRAKAVENHPDISFVCDFNVKKILKGEWTEPSFAIAVHSPTLTFGQFPKPSANKFYTHYLKSNSERPGTFVLLKSEWILLSAKKE